MGNRKLRSQHLLYPLVFMAFVSCTHRDWTFEPITSHGVALTETQQPIKGIKISYVNVYDNKIRVTYSDKDGKFTFYDALYSTAFKVEDVDGQDNGGVFESQELQFIADVNGLFSVTLKLKK
ncbi:MAG: hypothetical protein RSB85_02050 [Rikenellaceae bacterium]